MAADTGVEPAGDPSTDAPLATDVADAAQSGAVTAANGGLRWLAGDAEAPLMLANLRESMQVCTNITWRCPAASGHCF